MNHRVWAALMLASLSACAGLVQNADTGHVEQGMSSTVAPTTRHPGRIAGVVLEIETLRGIEGAQIVVNDSVIGVTDHLGWFDVPLPSASPLHLQVQSIGYRTQRLEVDRPSTGGLNARLFLSISVLDGCGMPGGEIEAGTLQLIVRDVATGHAPDSEVRAEIGGPGGRRWTAVATTFEDVAGVQIPLRQAGRYSLRVSARGYGEWYEPEVVLPSDRSCLFKGVWLLQSDK